MAMSLLLSSKAYYVGHVRSLGLKRARGGGVNNEGNTYRKMDKWMSHCIPSVSNCLIPILRSGEERHTSASPTKDERFRPLEYVLNHDRLPVIPIPYQFVFEEIQECALISMATMNKIS